jgi:hypothetical protein
MKPDPGLQPTREIRTKISREHDNDPRRLVAYYMEYQRRFSGRLRWTQDAEHRSDETAEQGDADSAAARRR